MLVTLLQTLQIQAAQQSLTKVKRSISNFQDYLDEIATETATIHAQQQTDSTTPENMLRTTGEFNSIESQQPQVVSMRLKSSSISSSSNASGSSSASNNSNTPLQQRVRSNNSFSQDSSDINLLYIRLNEILSEPEKAHTYRRYLLNTAMLPDLNSAKQYLKTFGEQNIHYFATQNNDNMIDVFIAADVNPEALDSEGHSPLDLTLKTNANKACKRLMNAGAKMHIPDNSESDSAL